MSMALVRFMAEVCRFPAQVAAESPLPRAGEGQGEDGAAVRLAEVLMQVRGAPSSQPFFRTREGGLKRAGEGSSCAMLRGRVVLRPLRRRLLRGDTRRHVGQHGIEAGTV